MSLLQLKQKSRMWLKQELRLLHSRVQKVSVCIAALRLSCGNTSSSWKSLHIQHSLLCCRVLIDLQCNYIGHPSIWRYTPTLHTAARSGSAEYTVQIILAGYIKDFQSDKFTVCVSSLITVSCQALQLLSTHPDITRVWG